MTLTEAWLVWLLVTAVLVIGLEIWTSSYDDRHDKKVRVRKWVKEWKNSDR